MSVSLRKTLTSAAVAVAVLIFTQFILPGGPSGGGTPVAILAYGLILGLLTSLVSVGIVLIYRTARIINFAQAALGTIGGAFTLNYIQISGWPFPLALLIGIVVSALVGLAVELAIIRRFFYAPRLALTVLTIALAGVLGPATGLIGSLPIFPGQDRIRLVDLTQPLKLPFAGKTFTIGSSAFEFGFGHVFAFFVSILAVLGIGFFLRYTKAGIAIRAASENAERALSLSIDVKGLSTIVWTLAAVLSGIGIILTGTVTRFAAVSGVAPASLIPAMAAAVVARMRSLPVAIATSIALLVLRQAVAQSFAEAGALVDAGLFVLILIALLLQRHELQRSEDAEVSSWEAAEETRPVPFVLSQVPGIRIARWALIGIAAGAVLIIPWVTPTGTTALAAFALLTTIVILSLVVLTGWAGQVSLGQFALVGVAAVTSGAITSRWGLFWLVLLVVPVFTAAFAVLIGLPALRVRGLYLAIVTFAFSFAVEAVLFEEKYFGWLLPDVVDRPTLFFLDFQSERQMYYLSLTALVVSIAIVASLRRSRVGRVLISLRENEANLQSFGVSPVRARLTAFAISGFLCGLAGVLIAHHQRDITADTFGASESLSTFLVAVVGGIASIPGALFGSAYLAMQNLISGPLLGFLLGPLGILIILYLSPGGIATAAYKLRDAVLRIVAQRRQLIVPSLFADLDPETMSRSLIPLSEQLPHAGLAVIPFHEKYEPVADLYRSRGKTSGDGAPRSHREEAEALSAAAKAAEGESQETSES